MSVPHRLTPRARCDSLGNRLRITALPFLTRACLTTAFSFSTLLGSANWTAQPLCAQSVNADQAAADALPARSRTAEIIRQSNPQTPAELLAAVRNLLHLGEPELAREYIDTLLPQQLTDEERHRLVAELGSAFLIRLSREPQLAPQGQQLAQAMLEGARRHATAPTEIARRIEQLQSDDPAVQAAGRAGLRLLGADAVAPLMREVRADSEVHAQQALLQTLVTLGSEAQGPLATYLQSPLAAQRATAVLALGQLGDSQTLAMIAALLWSDADADVRRAAAHALERRLGVVPELPDARTHLRTEIQHLLVGDGLDVNRTSTNLRSVWGWDSTTNQPQRLGVVGQAARAVQSAQLASHLEKLVDVAGTEALHDRNAARSMQPHDDTRADQQWVALALLTANAHQDALLPSNAEIPGDVQRELSAWPLVELEALLGLALQQELPAAAVGTLQLLGALGTEELLAGAAGQPRPLAQALTHGDRRVAVAAAEAILRIDPTAPFPGAATLVDLLGYLAGSEGRPRALIVHARSDQAGDIAGWLRSLGYASDHAATAREAEIMAAKHPDYEIILLSDTLGQAAWYELYQRLRRQPRVARVPLALLAGEWARGKALTVADSDPWAFVYPFPYTSETVQAIARQARRLSPAEPPTAAIRLQQAQQAIQWLERLGGDRRRYSFYEVLSWQDTLAAAIHVPELTRPAMRALARLGTPQAQLALVEFASDPTQTAMDRQAAANALRFAVVQSRLQLPPSQIRCQYDRYNQSEALDTETQTILGHILDTIERY